MVTTKKSEQGFSLVEMAIVMVIIGLIVAAVTVGKNTMQSAEVIKAYQKVVVPCIAAVSKAVVEGGTDPAAGLEKQNISLGGKKLECKFAKGTGDVKNVLTIKNATPELVSVMKQNLKDNAAVEMGSSTTKAVVTVYVPGG